NVMLIYNFNSRIIYILLEYKGFIYDGQIVSTSLRCNFLILLNFYYLTNSRYNYLYKLLVLYNTI
ncbi:hypothetical protein QBC32DRAFT_218964, partial [Pseudoneurospora amorphoporcata]